jgi:hypothetical protein
VIHTYHTRHTRHTSHTSHSVCGVLCVYRFPGAKYTNYHLPLFLRGMLSTAHYCAQIEGARTDLTNNFRPLINESETRKAALKSARFFVQFGCNYTRVKVTNNGVLDYDNKHYRNHRNLPLRTMPQDPFWGAIWMQMVEVKAGVPVDN